MPVVPRINFTEVRGDTLTYVATFTGITLTAPGTEIWFTGKTAKTADDTAAIWQKTVGDGITIDSATQATLTLAPADTAGLADRQVVYYDVQTKTPGGTVQTAFAGVITFMADVTHATA